MDNTKDKQTIQAQLDAAFAEAVRDKAAERNNTLRMLRRRIKALDAGSYAFNIVSVLTASYFVYSITGNYPILVQVIFGFSLMGLLIMAELAKRYAINEGAEGETAWFFAVAVLVAVSVYASYSGGDRFTVEMAVPVEVERNGAIDSLNTRIAQVDADIAVWKKQTWRGKIVSDARAGMGRLEQVKTDLIAQRADLERRDLMRNDGRELEHTTELRTFGNVFGVVAGAMDFLLIICLLIARKDERTARILVRANGPNRANEREQNERSRERTNERTNAPAPNTPMLVRIPPETAETPINTELAEYAKRTGETIADMKKRLAEAEERANMNVRERSREREQPNANANKANKANEQKRTNAAPKWVAQAKRMRANGDSYDKIAAELGKAKSTIHKWVKA